MKRTERFEVRLTKDERTRLEKLAASKGISCADAVRLLLYEHPIFRLDPPHSPSQPR